MQVDRDALTRVVAVINGKGGAGKTSVTANVAGLVANSGFRVLVVDMDPQGNLAEDFGYTGSDIDDEGQALSAALAFGQPVRPVENVRPNLDVLIGGHHLDVAAAALAVAKDQTKARLSLAHVLEPIAGEYDLIFIDCPPGIEALQTAAAAAVCRASMPGGQSMKIRSYSPAMGSRTCANDRRALVWSLATARAAAATSRWCPPIRTSRLG